VIQDHLQGRHSIGVYALLPDETCWFLAADFDGGGWREDVLALQETCGQQGVPALLERSRSGNRAHLWIFFSSPIPAALARKLGCFLLTETMNRRHQLGMDSYDRLFPNQDTMPQGGFGNLIALPLQRAPRNAGNTLFLDDALEPFPGPWGRLAAQRRMHPSEVEALVETATRQGRLLGVRYEPLEDGLEATPWERPPSGRPSKPRILGPLPDTIRAVLAQRIFVEKTGLPSALLAELKRLAAFQNPEFYQKQTMRFHTWGIPRIICATEDHPEHLGLPRGCQEDLEAFLVAEGCRLDLKEQRNAGEPVALTFQGQLTEMQQQAMSILQTHDLGIVGLRLRTTTAFRTQTAPARSRRPSDEQPVVIEQASAKLVSKYRAAKQGKAPCGHGHHITSPTALAKSYVCQPATHPRNQQQSWWKDLR
jgi:hypothetical protein